MIMNESSTGLTRAIVINNLRDQIRELEENGCTAENSTDLVTLQNAVRLLRTDRQNDREAVAEREFRAGTYLLIFSGGAFLAAAICALFGLSCAGTLGLLGALAVLLGATLYAWAVQTICG